MQINRQAATEIARQLRLRDIGGIIVVDFIDMHSEENQKEIIALLNSVLTDDKMKTESAGYYGTESGGDYQEKRPGRIYLLYCIIPVRLVRAAGVCNRRKPLA